MHNGFSDDRIIEQLIHSLNETKPVDGLSLAYF